MVALRQLGYKGVALRRLRRRQHLRIGGVPLAEADVFHHGIRKQHHILKYDGVVFQQCLAVHRGHVHAAQPHRSLRYVPEAGCHPGCRGLAAAGGSHQRRHLSLLRRKGNVS